MKKFALVCLVLLSMGCAVKHIQLDVQESYTRSFEDPQKRVLLIEELSIQCIEMRELLETENQCSFAYIAKKHADRSLYYLVEMIVINEEVLSTRR